MAHYREGLHFTGLVIVFGALAVVVALVFATMAVFGFGVFSQQSANFRGETAKRNLVEANGAFRAAAYDHFFDLCASVQGLEGQIAAQERELRGHPSADRREQLNANLTALRGQRVTAIAQYNADTRKGYTTGQFLADDLPPQLDPTARRTSCVA